MRWSQILVREQLPPCVRPGQVRTLASVNYGPETPGPAVARTVLPARSLTRDELTRLTVGSRRSRRE